MFGSCPGPYHYLCPGTRNQWLICSSYNFYDTAVVVNLAVCGIGSAGCVFCCQLPFDIMIDFSCQIFLDRIKCKRELIQTLWIRSRHTQAYDGLSEMERLRLE